MKRQKRIRTGFLLLPLLVVAALVIWACSGAALPNTQPSVQEQAMIEPTATQATEPTAIPAQVDSSATEAVTATVESAEPAAATSADIHVFSIDQTQSEARFTLNEELMGSPKTVVGITPLVEGNITIDLADPTQTSIGPIQIDARDFTTDSGMRNNAIRRFVLQSNNDDYRYIVFTPTAITGLPSTAAVGDSFELQIAGDLTISGVTKPATFVTTVTVNSETSISGLAKAQVLRSDFDLSIPNVPSVANVTDEVQLELQFVANAS